MATLTYNGAEYVGWDASSLRDAGVHADVVGAYLIAQAHEAVAKTADYYRDKLSSTSAGKLQAYRIKEEIARDPANADPAELALIEREAAARGMSRDDLISFIAQQSAAYRQVTLLIEVIEAETKNAISAISESDDDIQVLIDNVLQTAKQEADAEYQNALSLMG